MTRGSQFAEYDDIVDAIIFSHMSISVYVHPVVRYRIEAEAARRGCMWFGNEPLTLAGRRIVTDDTVPRNEARIYGRDEQVIHTVHIGEEAKP
jgi:predicted metal-dependent HD superfamily phosphohydrolase